MVIERNIKQADRAFARWSALSLSERVRCLRGVGKHLTDKKQRYGELMTADLDKTAGVTV